MYKVGDLITLEASGVFSPGIDIIVIDVQDGKILKAKAAIPDPRLGKHGFIEEDGEYIVTVWDVCYN